MGVLDELKKEAATVKAQEEQARTSEGAQRDAVLQKIRNFSITWGMNCKNGSGVWTRRAASSTVAPHGNGQNHPRARAQRR